MSDERPDQNTPVEPPADESRGAASVTLRSSDDTGDTGLLLDRANRSALDALRIAYLIMTWIMIGLVALFLLSGFQSVNEGERAVRLRFGQIQDSNLGAGFQFAFPPPIGELIKIEIGQQTLRVDEAFYPRLDERQRAQTIEQLAQRGGFRSYNPSEDGSLITADQNLAHAKWQVIYERSAPSEWLTHVDRDFELEQEIIRLSVERAAVRAISEITIDDLVKQAAGSEGSVARRAEQYAQEAIDRAGIGIQIVRLDMIDSGPPLNLYNDFAQVTSAATQANAERDRAQQYARSSLNAVAGAASDELVELIDRYERATDLGNTDEQEQIMAAIRSVMLGEAVELPAFSDNEEMVAVAENQVSGEVTQMISSAQTYRRQVSDEAQADLTLFRSKLDQYNSNKRVLVTREWASAVTEFLQKDTVQAMILPEGTDVLELLLNRDPEILREQEKASRRQMLNEANERRKEELAKPVLSDVNQGSGR